MQHRYFCLKMGPEDTRADEEPAQDHSGHSSETSHMPRQHPAHPSSSQTQVAPVPPMQRDLCCTTEAASSSKSGCKYARKENRFPSSSGKGRLPNIFFLNYYLRHSEVARVPSAIHPPRVGPPAADQTFYSCQEKVCCRRGRDGMGRDGRHTRTGHMDIRKLAGSASLWTSR